MKYIPLTQRVQAPQALQVHVKGTLYSIVLHWGEHQKARDGLTGTHGRHYGREQRHPSYFFWLYTSGSGTLELPGSRRCAFKRGTLAVVSPNDPHTVIADHSPSASFFYIGFAMTSEAGAPLLIPVHELLSAWSGESLPPLDFPVQLSPRLTRQLERLMEEYVGGWASRGMCHYFPAHKAVMEILCLVVENVFARAESTGHLADSPLMRVRMEIEHRYDEKLTLKGLADQARWSSEHLCRAFRQAFGTSPLAYQQELRLREAKSLLMTSSMGVGEIAYAVGFQSVYHFSRLFGRRVGCPPSRYRARLSGNRSISGKS